MSRTTRYALYGVIIVICIIAIIVSVFEAVSKEENTIPVVQANDTNSTENETQSAAISREELEEAKTNFKKLFKNDFEDFENSDVTINKDIDPEQDLVYTLSPGRITENNSTDSEAKYDIDLEFPFINHYSYNSIEIDNDTDYSTFSSLVYALNDELNAIKENNEAKGIKINYTGTLYKNILSIGILVERAMLDGSESEQCNFYTFNYDLSILSSNDDESLIKSCTLNDMFEIAGTSGTTINEEITKVVTSADKYASELSDADQNVFQRKLNSGMYDVSKTGNFSQRQYFIHNDNGKPCLYIIYAYGNDSTKWTTAIDVVKIPIKETE